MILRDLDALHWLHLAGMHWPIIPEMRHTKALERGTRIGTGTGTGSKGMIAIIIPHARRWLPWADMHPQQQQYPQDRLFLLIMRGHSLYIITGPQMNQMPAVALADNVKDPTYFQCRIRPIFRLHTSMTAINNEITLGSQHQPHRK